MIEINWNNKKSHTSIKDETTQLQHDQAAEWLYCRDQKSNKKKNNSAYLDSGSGIVHDGSTRRHRESKQHRQKREQRLEQQKQRFEAEMQSYEEERKRFDAIQQCNNE